MSLNSFSKTYSDNPALSGTLMKLQDFLSTKLLGDTLNENVFRGVNASWADVSECLSRLEATGVLRSINVTVCPNPTCHEPVDIQAAEESFCDQCEKTWLTEDCSTIIHYEILKTLPRSEDRLWQGRTGLTAQFTDDEANVLFGEIDEDFVYLERQKFEDGKKITLFFQGKPLIISRCSFLPEYGAQKRSYAYKYIKLEPGSTTVQNNNFQNNTGSIHIGSINQTANGLNAEDIVAVLRQMKTLATTSSTHDERLIKMLDAAIASKNDPAKFLDSVNAIVAVAANYSTVISPLLPTLMPLLNF